MAFEHLLLDVLLRDRKGRTDRGSLVEVAATVVDVPRPLLAAGELVAVLPADERAAAVVALDQPREEPLHWPRRRLLLHAEVDAAAVGLLLALVEELPGDQRGMGVLDDDALVLVRLPAP